MILIAWIINNHYHVALFCWLKLVDLLHIPILAYLHRIMFYGPNIINMTQVPKAGTLNNLNLFVYDIQNKKPDQLHQYVWEWSESQPMASLIPKNILCSTVLSIAMGTPAKVLTEWVLIVSLPHPNEPSLTYWTLSSMLLNPSFG